MPPEVQDRLGYALDLAQNNAVSGQAKRMKGDLRDVTEARTHNESGDSTFRATYTDAFGDAIYVLHVFQKKAKRGTETPKRDLELIRRRLKEARKWHEQEG